MSDRQKVDELRGELDHERDSDPVVNIVRQTRTAAQTAREQVAPQLDALEERIKDNPIGAVLVAIGVGYVIGRITA